MSSSAENRIQLEISLRMVLTATKKDEIEAVSRPFFVEMYHGKIVEHGPTKTIFENPKHEYTKRLFKAAPGQKWDFN